MVKAWEINNILGQKYTLEHPEKDRDWCIYEKLVESIWYLFYHEEVSFKRYLIDLRETCTAMIDSEERKEGISTQA